MSDDRTPTPSTPLPTLAIADADGIRRTVTGIDSTTTVGALADLLGIAGHRSVTIDGRPGATHGRSRTHRHHCRDRPSAPESPTTST